MSFRKVVLVSASDYDHQRDDPFLAHLVARGIELFCVVGRDAQAWENAMDWACIGLKGDTIRHITTTSHPNETSEEVIAFAKMFSTDPPSEVEVLYVPGQPPSS